VDGLVEGLDEEIFVKDFSNYIIQEAKCMVFWARRNTTIKQSLRPLYFVFVIQQNEKLLMYPLLSRNIFL
jgi:hypothetical protein